MPIGTFSESAPSIALETRWTHSRSKRPKSHPCSLEALSISQVRKCVLAGSLEQTLQARGLRLRQFARWVLRGDWCRALSTIESLLWNKCPNRGFRKRTVEKNGK